MLRGPRGTGTGNSGVLRVPLVRTSTDVWGGCARRLQAAIASDISAYRCQQRSVWVRGPVGPHHVSARIGMLWSEGWEVFSERATGAA